MYKFIVILTLAFTAVSHCHASESEQAQSNNEQAADPGSSDAHAHLLASEKKRRERQDLEHKKREEERLEEEAKERAEQKRLDKQERKITIAKLKQRIRKLEDRVAEQDRALNTCHPNYGPTPKTQDPVPSSTRSELFDMRGYSKPSATQSQQTQSSTESQSKLP